VVHLSFAVAMVLVVGDLPVGFFDQSWRIETAAFLDRWWVLTVWDLEMRWRWISVVLMVWLFQWRLLPLFVLVKDLNVVLELYEPCSLSVSVLPSGFGSLSCGLFMSDSFLFLT
jgi:hypothetical protein